MKQNFRHRSGLTVLAAAAMALLAGCGDAPAPAAGSGHGQAQEDDYERGPHNGRLLRDGDVAMEITIFESGVPPEFRVYPYRNDEPLDPNSVSLTIELGRLGNRVDRFEFAAQDDFLRGHGVVLEPHSFDVSVSAEAAGRRMQWRYESYEGRTQIEPGFAQAMGIEVEAAGPAPIRSTIAAYGALATHPDATVEVRGRFPGVVQALEKEVGDTVRAGEELARLQSNESLQSYVVAAPRTGVVIARAASVGSSSTEAPLYVIADLNNLVADLKVYPQDQGRVAVGQEVTVATLDGEQTFTGRIDRILPALDAGSRAATARVLLGGAAPGWRPGQFVEGTITVDRVEVPLAVRQTGLQGFRDFTVVYARVDDTYEVRMLDLGRSDGQFVEVLGGLEPGTLYVSGNSYLIKADIEKSGASHDH
jgi:cobalt-zinc-cadmium efflux system membrane fusion protein